LILSLTGRGEDQDRDYSHQATLWNDTRARNAEQNLESRAKERAEQGPSPRSSPILGEGKKEPGFFAAAALNDTRTGLKVERHASWLNRGWGASAGVEKDPGSLGFARDDTKTALNDIGMDEESGAEKRSRDSSLRSSVVSRKYLEEQSPNPWPLPQQRGRGFEATIPPRPIPLTPFPAGKGEQRAAET
jgi:hypothetical protein